MDNVVTSQNSEQAMLFALHPHDFNEDFCFGGCQTWHASDDVSDAAMVRDGLHVSVCWRRRAEATRPRTSRL